MKTGNLLPFIQNEGITGTSTNKRSDFMRMIDVLEQETGYDHY